MGEGQVYVSDIPTEDDLVEAYRAGDLSGVDLVRRLRRRIASDSVCDLIGELHDAAARNRRQHLRDVKLWRLRRERVLELCRREMRECQEVLFDGQGARGISTYLGLFGGLYWTRDGRGTYEDWQAWKADLRAYAMTRTAMLMARIGRVEAMEPPGCRRR